MTAIGYIFLVAVLSTTANAQRVPSRTLQGPQRPTPIAYTLQLPKLQDPAPFYNPSVSSDLRPPSNAYHVPVVFYEYPTPSQELQVPNEEPWNPNNEEAYYFHSEFPVDIEKPTNSHPKKYNKDVHEKLKLANASPKGGALRLDPDEAEQQRKTAEKFTKAENRKQLEKVPRGLDEPLAEASDHYDDRDDDDSEDINTAFTHSLGVRFPGDRFQFHMHGHKGPNSYKWGYDTGKGRNRQFRVEERDDDGLVKGQYGYVDKRGKLNVFDYLSDPKGGYTSKKHTSGDRK